MNATLPAWVTPGTRAVLRTSRGNHVDVRVGPILRVLKTKVALVDGTEMRNYRVTGDSLDGHSGTGWDTVSYELVAFDSVRGQALYAELVDRNARQRARNAARTFIDRDDVASARAAIAALTRYIENQEEAS